VQPRHDDDDDDDDDGSATVRASSDRDQKVSNNLLFTVTLTVIGTVVLRCM